MEDDRRSCNGIEGRTGPGDLRGELGLDAGRGGSSSGKACSCQGCKPVRRVKSARLSSKESSGGVVGLSIPPGAAKK